MLALVLSALTAAAEVTHPVFPPEYSESAIPSLKERVAAAVAMSPEELYAFVPVASGIFFCGCPNCDGGAQEHAMQWSLGMGDRVKCRHCGMEFPNDQFPHNREKVMTAPSGTRHVYRWHESAEGRQYFYEARAWYDRLQWTRDMALRLANLYALTGDDAYGDRAAAIVGRYAEVYPDYAIRFDYPFHPVRFWPADQKWPYDEDIVPFRGAKFYWWGYGDIPRRLARAYDLLAAGDAFDRMKGLLGEDIESRIETDLIRMGYDFTAANPDSHGNMSPGMYRSMVVAGRIIGAPDMVHEGIDRLRILVGKQFFCDGWWREGAPSYHWQTISSLESVAPVLKGYSDPPDWQRDRLEDVDLLKDLPMLARAVAVGRQGVLPDGRLMPVNDTWWTGKQRPLDESVCRLWPGLGHTIFGAGAAESQFQLHVNWSGAYGHSHADNGSIILFAQGREMLSDIGYTHTRFRNWTINSAAHNLVVVDERSQGLDNSTGNVLLYDDTHPNVRVVDLDASPAYPACSVYRRRLVHVHGGEGRDYVVDLFDVKGGSIHDFFLHGSADEPGTVESTVSFDEPVETLVPAWGGTEEHTGENSLDMSGEKHHAYMFLWEIAAAPVSGPWSATWQYGGGGLRSHLFAEADSTAYRFVSPAIRGARDDDGKLRDFLRRGIMVRHEGGTSRFAAVHEPFAGAEPWIDAVRFEDGVFTVAYGDTKDIIAWDGDRVRVTSTAGWSYDSGELVHGIVEALEHEDGRPVLNLDKVLPPVTHILLDLGGKRRIAFPVASVEGTSLTLPYDPGFTYDPEKPETRFTAFPQETFEGELRYTAFTR
jgi:Heparinase II/III-like protein